MKPPKCRLCQKEHWLSVGCDGKPHHHAAHFIKQDMEQALKRPNTSREGRRVLKGSTVRGGTAKPTRTASTERADPSTPAGEILANQTNAEKVRPGKPETAPRKRKAKNGRAKK